MMRRMCWVSARGNTEHCRDLEQEVSIALWLHFDKLRPDASPQEEKTWVRWTARSTLDHLNRRQRPPLEELTDAMSPTIGYTGDTSASEEMEELMAALSPEEQRLLQLYIEGYCGEEITATMGLKRDAVYQRMHRAASRARCAIVLIMLVVVASVLAVAVVPQLREWVFPRLSVTVQSQLDTMGEAVFRHSNLDCLRFMAAVPPIVIGQGPLYDVGRLDSIVAPCGSLDAWLADSYWGQFAGLYHVECNGIGAGTRTPSPAVYVRDSCIVVEGAEDERVRIYDVMGREVNGKIPRGVYIVCVGNGFSKKVVVR